MSTTVATARELDTTNARIDDWGRQHNKALSKINTLEGKIKTLESRATREATAGEFKTFSITDLFAQEYSEPVVNRKSLNDDAVREAADLFVRTLGDCNRAYLAKALKGQRRTGQAARALVDMLEKYPQELR